MGQIVGLTKNQVYQKLYSDTRSQIQQIVDKERQIIDDFIDNYNQEQKRAAFWGKLLSPVLPVFSSVRGLLKSIEDTSLAFASIKANFKNHLSHIFDPSDGTNWEQDLKYFGVDVVGTFIEGLSSASLGAGADVLNLMGVDIRNTIYGDDGAIKKINEYINSQRASTLEGRGGFKLSSNMDLKDWGTVLGHEKKLISDEKTVTERWVTDSSQVQEGQDQQRFQIYQDLMNHVEKKQIAKQNIDLLTLKPQYDAAFQGKKAYEFIDSAFENVGRMVPVMVLAYAGQGIAPSSFFAGASGSQVMMTASSSYFAASVYGQSFEQATSNGATMNDAYTFALGNMLLEAGTEQIGGFKLGEVPFSSFNKFFEVAFEEAMEEAIAELAQTGLSYYDNKENKIENQEETRASLLARVGYSAIQGAFVGVLLKGVSNISTPKTKTTNQMKSDIQDLMQAYEKDFGKKKTEQYTSKVVNKLNRLLNSETLTEEQKIRMLEESNLKHLFNVKSTQIDKGDGTTYNKHSFVLNDLGAKASKGDIFATQFGESISKETHAVGRNNYLGAFEEKAYNGQDIKIASKETIAKKNNASLDSMVKWAQRNNLPIYFVEVSGKANNGMPGFNGYQNGSDGKIFIDINSEGAIAKYISHEMHDTIGTLVKKGQVTLASFEAYEKFIDLLSKPKFLEKIPQKYFETINKEYSALAKAQNLSQEETQQMLSRELVSKIIEDFFDNETILKKAFNENEGLFRRVASIFTKPSTYNGLIEQMNLDMMPEGKKALQKIQSAFVNVLRENKSMFLITDNVNGSQKVLDSVFDQKLVADSGLRTSLSLKIPNLLEPQKDSIIKSIVGTDTSKKIVFHRTYHSLGHFIRNFIDTNGKEPFASLFVSDVKDFKWLGFEIGEVMLIPKKSFFENKEKNHFIFMPSQTRSARRRIIDGKMYLSSSWKATDDGYQSTPEMTLFPTVVDYGKYMKGGLTPFNIVRMFNMGVIFQGMAEFEIKNYMESKKELGEKTKFSESVDIYETFVNLINNWRSPLNISEAEIKTYNEVHGEFSKEDKAMFKEVLNDKLDKFFEAEFLFPNPENLKQEYTFSEFNQDFYGQRWFWSFLAKIADGQSLEGDGFLANYNGYHFRNNLYSNQESLINDAREFVSALYSVAGGVYYEAKSDLNIEDIHKVIVFAKKTSDELMRIKDFLQQNDIPLQIVFEKGEIEARKPSFRDAFLKETVAPASFSIKVDVSQELQQQEETTTREEQQEIESTMTPATKTFFEEKSPKQQEQENIKQVKDEDIEKAINILKKTSDAKITYEKIARMKAYKKLNTQAREMAEQYGIDNNLEYGSSHLIQTEQRRKIRDKLVSLEIKNAEKQGIKKNHEMIFVTGLPGSGKSSTLVNYAQEFYGAYVADSDFIKEKLPGYNPNISSVFHIESKQINIRVIEKLKEEGFNFIVPIVGENDSKILEMASLAKKQGYSVKLFSNYVSTNVSLKRVFLRALETERFFSLEYISVLKEDGVVENLPNAVFEKIKGDEIFDGYYKQNNEGTSPVVYESNNVSEFATYIEGAFKKFTENNSTTEESSRGLGESDITNNINDDGGNGLGFINRFLNAFNIAQNVDFKTYEEFENVFKNSIDAIIPKISNSKTGFAKKMRDWYHAWEQYIKQSGRGRKVYNHLGSSVSKTIFLEYYNLYQKIKEEKGREDKNPTEQELEAIASKINEAIFGALNYSDVFLTVPINESPSNPKGYLYTKAVHWFLRDLLIEREWTPENLKTFNRDSRGTPYRRLISAIINFNQKHGASELEKALKHFVIATNVEPIVDLSLKEDKNLPHTSETIKDQWEQNTNNIKEISSTIKYNTKINQFIDGFTVSEVLGLFDKNSWSQVLMDRIVRGVDRQLYVMRVFKNSFENDGWLDKHYHDVARLEKVANAREISGLGGISVPLSQVMYLRNALARELVRNKAIDDGIIDGKKTTHFKKDAIVRVLKITDVKAQKFDQRQDGKISDPFELLKELDSIIEGDAFLKEYNAKVLEMFSLLYPYINERYKEINGLILNEDGKKIKEKLEENGDGSIDMFFSDFPTTLNIDSIVNLYVPFLLDNSSYFKQDKVNFKEILDYGVFDGMTQELSDSNAPLNIESLTTVMNAYVQEVANYYGLHRVMGDLNIVLNEQMDNKDQTTYLNGNISHEAINFYKDLLLDSAGYKIGKRSAGVQKAIKFIRRNFYRASLAANIKVIFTQFVTVLNLTNIYGDDFFPFLNKMVKNFYAQTTPSKKIVLSKMIGTNNIYWDRSFNSTFEIGQASKEGLITGENSFNRLMEKMMSGIVLTDNAINKAFYLTLLETIDSDTGKNFTEEKASEILNKGILRSQSSALDITKSAILRTDSDVVRIFLKFMGEPMKHVTQVFDSVKQLDLIKKIKENKNVILEKQEEYVKKETQKLEELQEELNLANELENTTSYATLSYKEQKRIHKEAIEAEKKVSAQKAVLKKVKENKEVVTSFVKNTIDSEAKAKELYRRRVTAVISSIIYLSLLASIFQLIRSKGGEKDKKEDETMLLYLSKLVGMEFVSEIFSMLPFVRDVYQLVGFGYGLDSIDELGAFNDLGVSISYLIQAVTKGSSVNWGKTIRSIIISTGRVFGIPAFSLERIFSTILLYTNEEAHYKYQTLIGARNRDNIELARAIKEDNVTMIGAIVDHKISERNIKVSPEVAQEMKELTRKGYEVKITGARKSFTHDGVTYELNKAQQQKFVTTYNQADFIALKIIRSVQYRKLNSEMRRSILQAIYNYFYRLAKQVVIKDIDPQENIQIIPKENVFRNLNEAYKFFEENADKLYKKQSSPEYRKELLEKRRAELRKAAI